MQRSLKVDGEQSGDRIEHTNSCSCWRGGRGHVRGGLVAKITLGRQTIGTAAS